MKQFAQPIARTVHKYTRLIHSYTQDAQYNYKMLSVEVSCAGMTEPTVTFQVSGRKNGKLFHHTFSLHDPAVDMYNSIQYKEA